MTSTQRGLQGRQCAHPYPQNDMIDILGGVTKPDQLVLLVLVQTNKAIEFQVELGSDFVQTQID